MPNKGNLGKCLMYTKVPKMPSVGLSLGTFFFFFFSAFLSGWKPGIEFPGCNQISGKKKEKKKKF